MTKEKEYHHNILNSKKKKKWLSLRGEKPTEIKAVKHIISKILTILRTRFINLKVLQHLKHPIVAETIYKSRKIHFLSSHQ